MTTQEIIDELNAARTCGLDNWRVATPYFKAADDGRVVYLTPAEARREAERLRCCREAQSLDAIMPLLEQIAETGEVDWATIGTQHADVRAVVEAWKARQAC